MRPVMPRVGHPGCDMDYLGPRSQVSRAGLPPAALYSCRFGSRRALRERLLSGSRQHSHRSLGQSTDLLFRRAERACQQRAGQ